MTSSYPTVSIADASTHVKGDHRRPHPDAVPRPLDEPELVEQLRARPELIANRSFVIERAVDEFMEISRQSQSLSLCSYCASFAEFGSSIQSSIYRQLELERFVAQHEWLQARIESRPWPRAGDECGSFRVIEEVGRGALARVYLCSQPQLGDRQVIVKVSDSALLEADILGRLRHPNIVPIHSIEKDEASERMLLCMPFLGRSTLHDFLDSLKEGKHPEVLSFERTSRIWEQPSDLIEQRACPNMRRSPRGRHDCVAYLGERVAEALAHAHCNGIVHGDIKPSNILLSRTGEPLLMDFNLSGDNGQSVMARGGTLPYMPPEQLQSVLLKESCEGRYDARSDIYSLGIVLYEALTGRSPFPLEESHSDSQQLAEKLLARQRQGCVPLRRVDRTISASLAEAIERCLEFQPDDRPSTAAELQTELERERRVVKRARRHVSRHIKAYGFVGAATTAIVAASSVYVSNLPPRQVRLYQSAIALQHAGNLQGAEAKLSQVLAIDPSDDDARFAFARTALLQKDLSRARQEFYNLAMAEHSARGAAYVAYCFNLLGNPTSAIVWYERANEWGCDAPEVHNNLAVSYELGGSRYSQTERLKLAEKALLRALEQMPASPQIRLNWICLAVRKAQSDNSSVGPEALKMCRELAAEMPDDGFIQERAASAFATVRNAAPELKVEGIEFLRKAIQLGHGPDVTLLESSELWPSFRGHPKFQDLISALKNSSSKYVKGARMLRLLEPKTLAVIAAPDQF